jgi:hypothetical protein
VQKALQVQKVQKALQVQKVQKAQKVLLVQKALQVHLVLLEPKDKQACQEIGIYPPPPIS